VTGPSEGTQATPDGPAEIAFDAVGRPTIYAPTWDAAALGMGWACAIHRRAQLDLMRRRSQGRLAELAGPGAVPSDVQQRTLGLASVATACWAGLPASQRRLLEFYSAGVNAGTRDPGFGEWRPVDTIAVAQQLFQALVGDGADNRMVEVMRRTLPDEVVSFLLDPADEFAVEIDGTVPGVERAPLPAQQLSTLMAEPADDPGRVVVSDGRPAGSNAWAIAREGSVVLANDMHLELTDPSVLYAVRLVLPMAEAEGVTVPGLPMLIAGTNTKVAWGFTRLPGDVCDLREIEEGPGSTYLVDGHAEPYQVRRETIRVRGADDVMLDVKQTRWGPVAGSLAGRPVALTSPLTEPDALDFGLMRVLSAQDAHSAADVITSCGLPPLNAVIADSAGTALWTVAGRYPARQQRGPRGFADPPPSGAPSPRLPPHALPRLTAPPGGHVVTCNNGNAPTREAGLAWNFFPGCRARRAAAELAAGRGHDVPGAARLQQDIDASYFAFYRDLALRHLDAVRHLRGVPAALRDEISAWGGTAHRDERGLALLVIFRDLLREELFAAVTRPCQRYDDQFTYCYHGHERPLRRLLMALDDGLVPAPWATATDFVIGLLIGARTLLIRQAGTPEPVRWGTVNRLALTPGPDGTELSGCMESLLVAAPDFGAAVRLVVDLARPASGLLSLPGAPDGTQAPRYLARWADGAADPLPSAMDPLPSARQS
jgi:penicillin G amidase